MPNNITQEKIEEQIISEKKTVDFDTREFTIEFLVQKYITNIEEGENEIFVPEYQRDFVWDEVRQSRLIESLTLGLPIPLIFLAEGENGRLEIVDGSQRIRTLSAFLQNELTLTGLDKLSYMNNLKFTELLSSRQKKINNTPIRTIVLSETTTEQVRNDLFERINRGSDLLRNMEKRKGIYPGEFNDFIYQVCSKNELFLKLTPLSKVVIKRQEHQELILRFFAFIDMYPTFKTYNRGIGAVLDEYMDVTNKSFNNKLQKENFFNNMLEFVDKRFKFGFSKKANSAINRVLFETISVGSHFALLEGAQIKDTPIDITDWLNDQSFRQLVSGTHRTHEPRKIKARIDFVKEKLLA